jgi:tartrate-resistant acid phosphatase type 5
MREGVIGMSLIRPTRRELLKAVPALIGASALPAFGQTGGRPVRFFVIGDWGRGGNNDQLAVAAQMRREAADNRPAFIASTGDNFYTLGVSSTDDSHWRRSFQNVYSGEEYHRIPWHPVLGNHDYGGNVQAQLDYGRVDPSGRWQFDPDRRSGPPQRYYRKSIVSDGGGRADLFFIDTVLWAGREAFPFNLLGSRISRREQQEQVRWLSDQLLDSEAPFKFVFGHHGIHSIGPHGGTMQMAQLDDMLRYHRVTAYIHGHDHCLFHIENRGMHYICSGGGSEVKADYHGGLEPGCVYANYCDLEGRTDRPFPIWRSFIPDAGFATFDLYADRVDVALIGRRVRDHNPHRFVLSPTPRESLRSAL